MADKKSESNEKSAVGSRKESATDYEGRPSNLSSSLRDATYPDEKPAEDSVAQVQEVQRTESDPQP